jgi:hypothetical protein
MGKNNFDKTSQFAGRNFRETKCRDNLLKFALIFVLFAKIYFRFNPSNPADNLSCFTVSFFSQKKGIFTPSVTRRNAIFHRLWNLKNSLRLCLWNQTNCFLARISVKNKKRDKLSLNNPGVIKIVTLSNTVLLIGDVY